MDKELTRTIIKDQKVYFGDAEFTSLVKTLIRIYRFRSKDQIPEAVVIPNITEVEGVKIEFTRPKKEVENG